jgi:hypothetical protein
MTDTLKPDSQEAVESGCTCSVTCYGAEYGYADGFLSLKRDPDCPLHGFDDGEAPDE